MSLHPFPKNPEIRQKWVEYVRTDMPRWPGTNSSSRICSLHFSHKCFSNYSQVEHGFASRLLIKKDSYPDKPRNVHQLSDHDYSLPMNEFVSEVYGCLYNRLKPLLLLDINVPVHYLL